MKHDGNDALLGSDDTAEITSEDLAAMPLEVLLEAKDSIEDALANKLLGDLDSIVEDFIKAFGAQKGIEMLCKELFHVILPSQYPGGLEKLEQDLAQNWLSEQDDEESD